MEQYILAFIDLFAGLGAFLLGFKLLSDNMEKLASGALKKMFSKTDKNKLVGVGIGAASTAIVQSSAVTTVMVVGFVNMGIMSLYQATAIIMGANIGTTITAQIAALQSFDIIHYVTLLTAVGMFMTMFSKNDKVKSLGFILAGLGLVFVGLQCMSNSMSIFKHSEEIKGILQSLNNPFLLLLFGIATTALVQSSSVITTIVISMVGQGLVIGTGCNDVLFLILGTNIGSCITALISSIGTNRNAKRACIIHLMFNTFGAVLFTILLLIWRNFMDMTFVVWFSEPSQQIAMFHTFFNVICTLIFLPFINVFVYLSGLIIPEKTDEKEQGGFMDKRLLKTPSIAIEQLGKACIMVADKSMENLKTAFYGYINRDESVKETILNKNEEISALNQSITDYLVLVSGEDISMADEKIVSTLHHNLGDIERISEIADNLTKYTHREIKHNLVFSSGVNEQLEEMFKKLEELYGLVRIILEEKDVAKLSKVDALEEEVDAMRKKLINEHIERLNGGYCKAENSSIFINLVSNLERVGDHLAYVAHSIDEI